MRSKNTKHINRTVDRFRLLIRLALCFIIAIVLLSSISCKQSSGPTADKTPEPPDVPTITPEPPDTPTVTPELPDMPIPSQPIIDDAETETPTPISPDKLPLR